MRYWWISLLLVGCIDEPVEHATPARVAAQPVECAKSDNDAVRLKLAPDCAGCHGPGTSAPYFASAEAFEGLVVQNPRFVTPGNAQESGLIKLLEGRASGAFTQMPTAGEPWANLPTDTRQITIDEVRAWIDGLNLTASDPSPFRDAPTTRRLGADEFQASLMSQLGLTFEDDFFGQYSSNFESATLVLKGPLPLRETDGAPGLHYVAQRAATARRWTALGGADWLNRKPRSYEISPSYLQTVTQVSQAWCELAVNKPNNPALFRDATPDDTSATASEAIRANIAYLHLRMLGVPATSEGTDRIFSDVFVAHESEGTRVAWTAVCSYFVRHPLWLSL